MEKNCKFCKKRKYIVETVWTEVNSDNIILRMPCHIGKVSCSGDPKLYDMFMTVNKDRDTDGISLPCFESMPFESWFDDLVKTVNSYYTDCKIYSE